MIPLLLSISLNSASRLASAPQPSYVVVVRDVATNGPRKAYRPAWRIAVYGVGRSLGKSDGAVVRRALPIEEVTFVTHSGVGNPTFLPRPGAGEFALLLRDDRGSVRYVDVWSARPLRRIASIPCENAVRLDWMPGTSLLSIVERRKDGFDTRVVTARGRSLGRITNAMGAVSDPRTRTHYAVRYSLPGEQVKRMVDAEDGDPALARAIRGGRISFAKLGAGWRVAESLSARDAARVLLGPEASLDGLARIAPPHRPVGFARNWTIVRAGVLGSRPNSGVGLVFDQLGYPRGISKFIRSDAPDPDEVHCVSAAGTLLYSNGYAGDGYRVSGRSGDRFAAAIDQRWKRYWLLRGVGKSVRSVVLWAGETVEAAGHLRFPQASSTR